MNTSLHDSILAPSKPHDFGFGEIVSSVALALTLTLSIFMMVWVTDMFKTPVWLLLGVIVLMLGTIFAGVAVAMGLKNRQWLLGNFAFAGLLIVMACFKLGPAGMAGNTGGDSAGVDFFLFLAGLLLGVGACMSHQGIGAFPKAAPAAAPADSLEAQLVQLKKLQDQNLISPAEYEAKRQQILAQAR